jgi:hypothetical protein
MGHGAEGSSWNQVVLPLLHKGLKVVCAPIPLTSLSEDIAALNRVFERTEGPVLLAGHAYAGHRWRKIRAVQIARVYRRSCSR